MNGMRWMLPALLPGVLLVRAHALEPAVAQAFERYMAIPAAVLPVLQKVKDKAGADAAAPELQKAMADRKSVV